MSRPTFGVLLRLVIGWHFLYEGWVKLIAPSWSAAGYLQSATGPLSRFFHWMGSTDWLVRIVDPLNVWGLLLVGLGLSRARYG